MQYVGRERCHGCLSQGMLDIQIRPIEHRYSRTAANQKEIMSREFTGIDMSEVVLEVRGKRRALAR